MLTVVATANELINAASILGRAEEKQRPEVARGSRQMLSQIS
jgi:hypothetical protein